jgi:hypothetical protein
VISTAEIPNDILKVDYVISTVIAVLMTLASIAGLLFPERLYPTEDLRNSFLANEVVNLLIGLPILVLSMWRARRGHLDGLLLWPGALLYILYNYVAYTIGIPYSLLTVVYLALVLLSAYAILDLSRKIDQHSLQKQLGGFRVIKISGWVLTILGSLFLLRALGTLVMSQMNQFTLPVAEMGVLVADMLLSTIWIVGGVLLIRRKPLGIAGGLALLFSASALFLALIIFLLLGPVLAGTVIPLADIIVVLAMGMTCFIPFYFYLRAVLSKENHHDTI